MGNFRSGLGILAYELKCQKKPIYGNGEVLSFFFSNLRATDLATLCTIIGIASQFVCMCWVIVLPKVVDFYFDRNWSTSRSKLMIVACCCCCCWCWFIQPALFAGTGHFQDRPIRCVYGGLYLHDRYTIKLWWPFSSFSCVLLTSIKINIFPNLYLLILEVATEKDDFFVITYFKGYITHFPLNLHLTFL